MHGLTAVAGCERRLDLDRFETISEDLGIWVGFEKFTKSPGRTICLDKRIVYIEGIIYNLSHEQIISHLSCIVNENDEYKKKALVKKLQNESDGEFIVFVIPTKEYKGYIFADKYSRLPLYYTSQDGIMISRNLNEFVYQFGVPKLNIQAVNEFLVFEFFLGNKTFFENIFRLEPLEMLEIDLRKSQSELKLLSIDLLSYDEKTNWSYRQFLQEYSKRFEEAVGDRVSYFLKNDQKIACTLSGGYDSRAIFGQLNKQNTPVTYFTYEYIQDESVVARTLVENLGKNCGYRKLSFDNSFSFNDAKKSILSCQGLATLLTGQVCLEDNYLVSRQMSSNNLWGGFGGEFVRHPYKTKYKNLFLSLEKGILTFDIFEFRNHFKNFNLKLFCLNLQKHFDNYVEKTENGKLKHFYNEYYIHRVGNGEDIWGRKFFWTVHPMMARRMIDLYCEMPLRFASYNTFRRILRMISPALLSVPIFRESFDLSSNLYILKDFFIWAKKSFFKIIQCHCPTSWKWFRLAFARCAEKNENEISTRDMKWFFFLLFQDFKSHPLKTLWKVMSGAWKPTLKRFSNPESIPFLSEIYASKMINTYFNVESLVSRLNSQVDLSSDRVYSFLLYLLEIEKLSRDNRK